MCNSLYGRTGGTVRLLLSSLRQYLSENMITEQINDETIRRSVARLYRNADHRRIIEQIIKYRPTVKAVLEQVAADIEAGFAAGRFGKSYTCTHDYWPANDDYTPELRLWMHGLNVPTGASICYMLRSKPRGPKPFIGDQFTLLLNAWCENDVARRQIQKITSQLPLRQRHTWKRWKGWEVLWEGESHELADLDKGDVARLTTNLLAAVEVTFKPLCTALKSIQAK
jgi:hypothetical protein